MSNIEKMIIITGTGNEAVFTGTSLRVKADENGTLAVLDSGHHVGAFPKGSWQSAYPDGSLVVKNS